MATGIIYSIIAPLMTLFVVMAFGMYWLVFRYNTLYAILSENDSGGLLYPTALNQLFTGIYVLEIYLIGLFLLVRDENQAWCCIGQAAVMILMTTSTIGFQVLVNNAFGPLLVYLPTMHHRYDGACSHTQGIYHGGPLDPGAPASQFQFQHKALLVQRPMIWIPKDSLGISDNEVSQTRSDSAEVSISNEGAIIDMKGEIEPRCHPSKRWQL